MYNKNLPMLRDVLQELVEMAETQFKQRVKFHEKLDKCLIKAEAKHDEWQKERHDSWAKYLIKIAVMNQNVVKTRFMIIQDALVYQDMTDEEWRALQQLLDVLHQESLYWFKIKKEFMYRRLDNGF